MHVRMDLRVMYTKKILLECLFTQGSSSSMSNTTVSSSAELFSEVCSQDFLRFAFEGRGYQVSQPTGSGLPHSMDQFLLTT
jgi:hypothetical protein